MEEFQSLFYWKYHFNIQKLFCDLEEHFCFNPYFTGSTTSTYCGSNQDRSCTKFQSLFYWKYHFNPFQSLHHFLRLLCFNPYFTGSTTSTICMFTQYWDDVEFQSLFYWKYHFNSKNCRKAGRSNKVSILILLEVPLQPN